MINLPELVKLLNELRPAKNKPVRVLDPCYCFGHMANNFAQSPFSSFAKLTHMPSMTLGGSFEVNEEIFSRFQQLQFDVILTNPPWSIKPLLKVLDVLFKLADCKRVPLLFLLPSRCVTTVGFEKLFQGKTLVSWKIPILPFHGYKKHLREAKELFWYGYNIEREDWNILRIRRS